MEMCLNAISAQLSDLATTISNGFFEISFMNQKKTRLCSSTKATQKIKKMVMRLEAISAQLSDLAITISDGFFEFSFVNPKNQDFAVQQK